MTGRDAKMRKPMTGLGDLRALALEAEPLAPWMSMRIENVRGTVKRDDLSQRDVDAWASLLRIEMRNARRRIEEGKTPRHSDIMDANGLRPMP